MFLKLGFKSVTMDDIACEMCISKKTIYKYFSNKEMLIEEGTEVVHQKIHTLMNEVIAQNHNAIAENFLMREMFKEMFQSFDHSPAYQLKKHYPEIYQKMMANEIEDCSNVFRQNIEKGIAQGLYRAETVCRSGCKILLHPDFFDQRKHLIRKRSLRTRSQSFRIPFQSHCYC